MVRCGDLGKQRWTSIGTRRPKSEETCSTLRYHTAPEEQLRRIATPPEKRVEANR